MIDPSSGPSLEHFQHPLGDDIAADHVTGRQQHRDKADDQLGGGIGHAQNHHGADQNDAVNEVRPGHQRRMQNRRHPRNHLDPGKRGQHENIQCNPAFHNLSQVNSVTNPSTQLRARCRSWNKNLF